MPDPVSTEPVVVTKENGVAWIKINRPQVLNAIDAQVLRKLREAVDDAGRDPEVGCLVLCGEGRAFSAGADVRAFKERQGRGESSFRKHLEEETNPLMSKLRSMDKPVVSMINGVAAGMGMSLALAADIKVMAEDAKFVEAFAKIGLIPDAGATYLMAKSFGFSKAMELALTGEEVGAEEAKRLGAVNRVVPSNRLEAETRLVAEKLARGPLGARVAKRAMNRAVTTDFDAALDYEAELQDTVAASDDFKEGVAAFSEKRAARFQGK